MSQLFLFAEESRTWTVTEVNRYIREMFESDYRLQDIWIAGEVSNLSRPVSGHVYFTLKDAGAALRCVMWRNSVLLQAYLPENGAAVEVRGSLSVYELGGQYQLYADEIREVGAGTLFQQFEALKRRLEAEGLFTESRKRPLPAWPARIGLVTSATGAALRDILNTLRRRFPVTEAILCATSVQGQDAPLGIVMALEALNEWAQPDVIILARGGGSLEDLWAFNDERVARAIARSQAPVISGVGHETDFTIADFVADLRAPTPTAAAVLATPDLTEVRVPLHGATLALADAFSTHLQQAHWELAALSARLNGQSPIVRLSNSRQRVDELSLRAGAELRHALRLRHERLNGLAQAIYSVSPLNVLARGYALVTAVESGKIVKAAAQVSAGQRVRVRVSEGEFEAERVTGDRGQGIRES